MSGKQRAVLLGLAAVVAVVAVVVLSGGSSDDAPGGGSATSGAATSTAGGSTTASARAGDVVVVKHAKPVGGVRRLTYGKGDTVDLTVESDTADEIHVHGYDLKKDVAKGGTAHFRFPATIDGVFVVELESHGEQIASLEVQP